MTRTDIVLSWVDKINAVMKHLVYVVLLLMAVIVYHVIARYAFAGRTDWCMDIELFTMAILWVVPIGYALLVDAHVRIDLMSRRYSPMMQEIIIAASCLSLIVPVAVAFTYYGWELFYSSWVVKQTSLTSAELPVYPHKFTLPLAGVLLLIQALNETVRHSILAARRRKE